MNKVEKENYRQDGQYFQDDIMQQYKEDDVNSTPLDNSVTNDEEQNISQNINNQDNMDSENDLYKGGPEKDDFEEEDLEDEDDDSEDNNPEEDDSEDDDFNKVDPFDPRKF